jgi:Protein of unknown function (DUF2716)
VVGSGDRVVAGEGDLGSGRPHRIRDEGPADSTWPIEIYPDGDSYIWLAEDLRYGTFGHPWEPSLCVFGEELVTAVAEVGDEALGRILRRNGCPTRAARDSS